MRESLQAGIRVSLELEKTLVWPAGYNAWAGSPLLVFFAVRAYTYTMNEINDIIDHNLKILFIGFNPGLRSAETGHHFAGYSNRFWKLLHQSGLTPRQFAPEEDRQLLHLALGITNIVDRPSREAAELSRDDYDAGREQLKRKLEHYRPRIACYEGIGVYKEFARVKAAKCGRQISSVVEGIVDFVVPSPSGKNPILFNTQLEYYLDLQRLIQ